MQKKAFSLYNPSASNNNRRDMYIHNVGEDEIIFDSKEDYDFVTCLTGRKTGRRKIYIDRSNKRKYYAKVSFNGKNIPIHHLLVGKPEKGKMIDHFNGNSLDNRKSNLRHVTRSENCYNKPSKSNLRCITQQKNGRFQVCMRLGLGTFDTLEEAKKRVRDFLENNGIKIYEEFYE